MADLHEVKGLVVHHHVVEPALKTPGGGAGLSDEHFGGGREQAARGGAGVQIAVEEDALMPLTVLPCNVVPDVGENRRDTGDVVSPMAEVRATVSRTPRRSTLLVADTWPNTMLLSMGLVNRIQAAAV